MAAEMLTETSRGSPAIFPGFKFSPTDVELLSYYLKRKIDRVEKFVEVIPEVDIYNFEPWDLPDMSIVKSENEWFFFCYRGRKYPHGSQNKRATQMGYWKATGKERDVKLGSEVIGTKRTLVFHMGRAPRGERTEWIMHEYCMKEVLLDALVICRLRRNIEFEASSSQKTPDRNIVSDKANIVQNELAQNLHGGINDTAESSRNPQEHVDEDLYAEILRDEIINIDQAPIHGSTREEISSLEMLAETLRALPLPTLKLHPSPEDLGEEKKLPSSSCSFGFFSINMLNPSRLCRVVALLVTVGLLVFYVA